MKVGVTPGEFGIGRLFNEVRDAVVVADVSSGAIVLWNLAAERLLGFKQTEAIGRPIDMIIPERFRDRHRNGLARYRRTHHGPIVDADRPVEIFALHRDGHEIPVELTLSPMEGSVGGAEAVMAIIRDISDRLERARLQQERIEQLSQIDNLKTEFLGVLSHELRTPLNAITGFGSILQDEVSGDLNDAQHAYLEQLMSGAERLLGLVNDLLDMAQIKAGRIDLRREPVQLGDAALEVLRDFAAPAHAKRIRLECDVPADLPVLDADPQRIGQIVRNLVSNAIKFAPEGGWVRVGALAADGSVEMWVEDNGPGIAEADFSRLFRPFSQLDMSMTRTAGGTGLGLSISKALVESHGGTIGVDSAPGKGSRFWFKLPLGPEETAGSRGGTG